MSWSSPPSSPDDRHYTLPNEWDFADERLALLGAAYDSGSIAHLADLPGLGGEVAQLDLFADDIPERAFDFVHTRFVLLHIADRDIAVERLARALAPGGVLLLEEGDGLGVLEEMPGAFGEVWRAFARSTEIAGASQSWARNLPAQLEALGLVDVHAEAEIPMFRGGSPMARMWNLTWVQAHDTLVDLGVPPEVIATARAELADERRWLYAPPTVRAWAHRDSA
ncbi:methyltransferase [Nocardia sp. N2S4-5]|uniref:methyltransferase n=1 Tax=Nocardia sp. N2S4-5 TaxID=3351565 RepID=UPI0037D2DB5C